MVGVSKVENGGNNDRDALVHCHFCGAMGHCFAEQRICEDGQVRSVLFDGCSRQNRDGFGGNGSDVFAGHFGKQVRHVDFSLCDRVKYKRLALILLGRARHLSRACGRKTEVQWPDLKFVCRCVRAYIYNLSFVLSRKITKGHESPPRKPLRTKGHETLLFHRW